MATTIGWEGTQMSPSNRQSTVALTDSQIAEVLALARDSDSVELKLTVPDARYRATVKGLGMDPLDAQIRQVFFFDTPDLRLNQAGVVVRARRVQKRGDDTVVKLRPVVPAELPDELRRSKDVSVEVDAMPGGFVCSASMKGSLHPPKVKEVAAGARPVHELFSKGQRAFYAAHAPAGLELDDLSILGPILVLKLKLEPRELGRRVVAELWLYPDGASVLELSTKAAPTEAFEVAVELRSYLAQRGLNLTGEQQTKTKLALEYFAANLGR